MNQPRSRTGLKLFSAALVLLIVALIGAACAPQPAPAAPAAPAAATANAPATSAPSQPAPAVSQAAADASGVPVGVDADGNFYRGNLNAAVKLVEFSDFQ